MLVTAYPKEVYIASRVKEPVFEVCKTECSETQSNLTLTECLAILGKAKDFEYSVDIGNGESVVYSKGLYLKFKTDRYSVNDIKEHKIQ